MPSRVLAGKVAQGEGLAGGESAAAQAVVRRSDQVLGTGVKLPEERQQPLEDGGRSFAVQLLIDDRLKQGLEGRMLALETERVGASALDEATQDGVGCGELADGER